DNELWLGLALMSGHLDELDPADLAAVLEALSTEVNRPDLWSGFPPPPAAEQAQPHLRGIRREQQPLQEQASGVKPLWCEPELMGLVHAWAKGVSWNDLIANTSLDEGDVVRIMRRTVDLLAQIPYCEAIT
ncbi:MAG: DEAD/DEAH box helicase, partial [bacterium]